MKVLIHGLNYAPEKVGVGRYTGELGEWLAERGHEVRVVTAPPYYPDWSVKGGGVVGGYRREKLAGAEVLRCPLWVPKNPSGLRACANRRVAYVPRNDEKAVTSS